MTQEKKEAQEIVLPEEVAEEKVVITEESLDGLNVKEKELARKHNMVTETKETQEETTETKESDDGKVQEKEKEVKEDKAEKKEVDFEKVAENDDSYKKFNANEKALYHRWKEDKKKRQLAEAERDLLKLKIKSMVPPPEKKEEKNEKIEALEREYNELLNKPDDELLSVGELKRIRQLERQISDENGKKQTQEKTDEQKKVEDFQRVQTEKLALLEKTAREEHADWEKITELAKSVMQEDKDGVYFAKLNRMILSDDPEENKRSIDYVVKVAKLHPDYKKEESVEGKEAKAEKKDEKAEKIQNNLTRRASSASVSGGGSRTVAEDDLSLEDAIRLTPEQYSRLKPETRRRLLGG